MNAEILSVGTELLLGHTVNTDASFVARELSTLGVNLLYACTVGDNPGRLEEAMKLAISRSGLIVTTGGLGPTGDDLTKETVAQACGVPLVLHNDCLEQIKAYFKNRPWSPTQEKQAWLPQGCYVLKNDNGTAPGCMFRARRPDGSEGPLVVMLPGPPSELIPMLKNYAMPALAEQSGMVIVSHMVHVFGMGEGLAAEKIADLTEGTNPTAATYAKDNEMFVRVTARAATQEEAETLCAPMVAELLQRFGNVAYSVDIDSLEETVVQGLSAAGLSVATAESCTGGLIAKRLTDVPGASSVFQMGAVTYANEIKTLLLEVPAQMLAEHGAVSEPVARAMAEGVRRKAGSALGLGVTGIAGPDGGTPEKPVGLVYIALSDGEQTWVRHTTPPAKPRSRSYVRNLAANTALDMVRRYLSKLPIDPDQI